MGYGKTFERLEDLPVELQYDNDERGEDGEGP